MFTDACVVNSRLRGRKSGEYSRFMNVTSLPFLNRSVLFLTLSAFCLVFPFVAAHADSTPYFITGDGSGSGGAGGS